ncbi:MAG: quinolinate synthase NadA [Candidatus Hodarchaeales archaeon]|jgi:quinolinate synthase
MINSEHDYIKDSEVEIDSLYKKMKGLNWSREDCSLIAPLTLKINNLKKKKNAVILAHSYQMPQIIFGIADFVGDSYGLSKEAMNVDADIIVFCGVKFMAETAKIINPEKTVLLPSPEAGCSLAAGINVKDVQKLREEYVGIPIVCYVNTTAAVKAKCDVCVTSSNAVKIIKKLDSDTVIFLPDRHMTKNLGPLTGKNIIGWDAECIVHDQFTSEQVQDLREQYKNIKILAHSECDPSVAAIADLVGSTGDMIRYIKSSLSKDFALITECGLSERLRIEFPDKNFLGTCVLCPYMKTINLENTLQVLQSPHRDQIINIPEDIYFRAKKSLEKMFELAEEPLSAED